MIKTIRMSRQIKVIGGKSNRSNRASRAENPYGRAAMSGNRRLYVGNLSWDVSWQDLKDHFKRVGSVVRADVMTEGGTGRSKGCGIVEFSTANEAIRAMQVLNDTDLKGRLIFVREDREDKGGVGGSCRVYVGNLSWDVAWQDLKVRVGVIDLISPEMRL